MASAVVGNRRDVIACGVFVSLGQALEDIALRVGKQMARLAENIGEVGYPDRLEVTGGEARPGNDDIDGSQLEPLIDIRFLAQLRCRIDFYLVAPLGALGDFFACPYGFGMERLGRFIDVPPFEHGFGLRGTCRHHRERGRTQYCLQSERHGFPP